MAGVLSIELEPVVVKARQKTFKKLPRSRTQMLSDHLLATTVLPGLLGCLYTPQVTSWTPGWDLPYTDLGRGVPSIFPIPVGTGAKIFLL